MRLLHLTDRLTTRGGAHRHLSGVVEWLVRHGHDVHVAAGRDEGAEIPCPTSVCAGLDSRDAAAVNLAPLLEDLRPDLVHLHTIVNPTVLEEAASRPSLITVQDHRYFCPGRGKWTRGGDVCRDGMSAAVCEACFEERGYFQEMLGTTARRLEALRRLPIVVLSHYMKAELAAAGVDPERVAVIPPFVHGLDPNTEPDGPPCVLFVGRLTEHKGARDALAAWRRSEIGLPLVMAGTGPLREEMEAGGAEVLGWLAPPALSRVYRRARALLLPSRWQEPFGIAGLEALTMGVPVAGWESGGVGEWHPGPGLVGWGDVAALAEALRSAAGRRVTPPVAFGREELMARLMSRYREVAG